MRLVLIKHAQPEFDWSVAASEWELSVRGRRQAETLGRRLADLSIDALWHSPSPKAAQTATAIAEACRLEPRMHPGLIEHRRESVDRLEAFEFRAKVREALHRREEVVFGDETTQQASDRFAEAVDAISSEEVVIVVAHGTVISLYAERVGAVENAAQLWDMLTLPAVVVIDDGELHAVEQIPTRPFLRDEPIDEEKLRSLRDAAEHAPDEEKAHALGRLGDALRTRQDPDAVSTLQEAIELAQTDAGRAVHQLRLAIALQYRDRLIEAVDAFVDGQKAIQISAPDHIHFWEQHFGKCLIEAGRRAEGTTHLEHALELRSQAGVAPPMLKSTQEALAAARMRDHAVQ